MRSEGKEHQPKSAGRFYARKAWRWSWVITVPVVILAVIWLRATEERYRAFALDYEAGPNATLHRMGKMEFSGLWFDAKSRLLSRTESTQPSLPVVDLVVPEASLAELDSRLPYSGREYVKAQMRYPDGEFRNVKMRYRGDRYSHWAYFKKSIRIKTKKKALIDGMRSFNLIVPRNIEQLNNVLSNRLAAKLGLIAPKTDVVWLRLNGQDAGLRILAEQMGESTLRRLGRMPGDIYSGELIERDFYEGVRKPNFLWEAAALWKKSAVNNHYPEGSMAPLEKLLSLINASHDEATQSELIAMLDAQAFGRLEALHVLTGSLRGTDDHNWRLFYDPWRSQFEPVVWDRMGWSTSKSHPERMPPRLDMIQSHFHQRLVRNHQFLLQRHRALESFFETGQDAAFLAEVDAILEPTLEAVERDPYIMKEFESYSPQQIQTAMLALRKRIENLFSDVERGYMDAGSSADYALDLDAGVLKLRMDGRAPITQLTLSFSREVAPPSAAHIRYWVEGDEHEVDVLGAISASGSQLDLHLPLLARHEPTHLREKPPHMARTLGIEPAYYEVDLEGVLLESLLDVEATRGFGQPTRLTKHAGLEPIPFGDAFSIVVPQPLTHSEIWEGIVEVEGLREVDGDLLIQPGTTVLLREGASVRVRGRLTAEGLANAPIRFLPADSKQGPWGALAILGREADGTRLKHCEFARGSGLKEELYEYSGMLSIHDVRGVRIEDCLFRDSARVDDMLHAVYAEIEIRNSQFERSWSDAVDLDISSGLIEATVFRNSGNDGLDLMETQAVVRDSTFKASGDKGISVGEGSSLLALNDVFDGCGVGIQAKDDSEAVAYNIDFVNNRKAVDAYRKNWRYGNGGDVQLYKAHLTGNSSAFTVDENSSIAVYDSYVPREAVVGEGVFLHSSVDAKTPRQGQADAFHGGIGRGPAVALFEPHWKFARAERRGAHPAID